MEKKKKKCVDPAKALDIAMPLLRICECLRVMPILIPASGTKMQHYTVSYISRDFCLFLVTYTLPNRIEDYKSNCSQQIITQSSYIRFLI